ncbi:retrotransposon protein, putative, ty1-copia subclass [Tanacetum coccineum]
MAARGQNQGKGKNKLAYAPEPKITPPPKKEDPTKDSIYHQCIFTIELYTSPNKSWVYDTGCGTHICNATQGLRASRKLKPGALSFSIYTVSNKRAKLDLDSALLWHCRLGHISKKCIEKLQHDGLLNSTDLRAFEKCVPCMSGKMERKPYTHQVERAKGLLGLIHTDPKIPPPPKREDPAKDSICHECGETGHWKRNCPQYLAELLKKKKNAASGAGGSGIFTIELNTFLNRSWIYDTGCGTHICNTTQGLRASRKLKPGALSLYVGNGQREAVEAIGVFYLCLPSGLEIVLNNCHYAPSITRGVIFVSRLYEDGFINRFVNNTIQVSRNNMVYFSAIPRDGIFEIDLSNSYANESSIYTVSNKRAKLDLDSALLWHCRLGHISKKRIEKLQHDGLLNSTDLRAFEKCVPCMSGKMARKPYTHQVERAKDLLGLIHTDVCGPFKIMSRQGASYFVTFTDDFSRYGYVYLLKHKHEVFETFKVFQKEVENQLGKTIKSLCSDRGGEYMSQEFLDHLKDHRIIAHRTPPYTPQHNGVSERRNRTLLDMVRSMMSQTTLPKSFWDYALETAARILNMVPTKKVEKTLYEVWYGQDPKLSYLKVWGCEALVKQDALTKPEKLEPSGSLEDLEFIQEEDTHPSIDTSINHEEDDLVIDEPHSDIILICRSTRTRRPIDRMCLYINAEEYELWDLGEPANYKVALLDHESNKWLNAMNVEIQSIKDNEVWDLVDLLPNGKTVGSKLLFKKKTDMDGSVHTYKACLVAKGYTQTPGIDYEETFSPVADIRAIRILIAIAAFYDSEIWQMDNITSRFQQNLGDLHWTTVKNILKYLRNTKDMFLVYGGDLKRELRVSCYTDAGYLTDADDLKSQTGYVFVLNGEAEYIAAFDASKEAVWVRKFISGLGARHFRAKVHYLREVIEFGDIKLEKVHTDDNLADPFTKALAFPKHSELTRNIGMLPASSFM